MNTKDWQTVILWVTPIGLSIFLMVLISKLCDFVEKRKIRYLYKYEKKRYLLTKSESDFYKQLLSLFGDKYYIFPQIHLSSILNHKIPGQNWKKALNCINRKSVDYVFCEKVFLSPLLAVEFDDITHVINDRRDRDIEIERIFEEADFPLLRIPYADKNKKDKILQSVNSILERKTSV